MEVQSDTGHQTTASKLMDIMLYDNGAVNSMHPDGLSRYPKKHFKAITKDCEVFFEAHPDFLTDDILDEIAAGEYEENQTKYGVHPEYKQLDEALNVYFDVM